MKGSSRSLVAAIVIVAVLALLLAFLLRSSQQSTATVPSAQATVVADTSALTESNAGDSAASRAGIASRTASTDEASAHSDAAKSSLRIHGIVVDESSKPIANAQVASWIDPAQGFDLLVIDARPVPRKLGDILTDAAGGFSIAAQPNKLYELRARADRFAPAVAGDVRAGDDVRIVLHVGATIEGIVTRASDHAPVAGARFIAWGSGQEPVFEGQTDDAGRYRSGTLEPEAIMFQVLPTDDIAWVKDIELHPGERRILDVQLEPGAVLSGEVVDASTRRPIEGAELSIRNFRGKTVRTDVLGHYELRGAPTPTMYGLTLPSITIEINVRAPGFGGDQRRVLSVGGIALHADFALHPAITVRGRIVDNARRPVAGAGVTAIPERAEGNQLLWRTARSDDDGNFAVHDIGGAVGAEEPAPVSVFVLAEGFAAVLRAARPIAKGESVVEMGDIVLPPPALLAGVVVDESGAPVTNAGVSVWRSSPGTTMARANSADYRTTMVDAAGRFFVANLQAGKYVLRVWAEGRAVLEGVEVSLMESEEKTDMKLVLASPFQIAGTVLDPEGSPLGGAYVSVSHPGAPLSKRVISWTDASGRFTLAVAETGEYELRASNPSQWSASSTVTIKTVEALIPHVQAGTRDLVVQLPRDATIEGVVLGPDERPAALACVEAEDSEQHSLGTTFADAQGAFVLHLGAGAHVRLRATWSREDLMRRDGRGAIDLDHAPVLATDVVAGAKNVVLKLTTPAPSDPK